ncbi:MAG TPA: C-terminal binding protein [Gaiellales bacterium]|nr:C-terminal binding protein [Gaiellales bacterium]
MTDPARPRAVYLDVVEGVDLHGAPAILEAAGFDVHCALARTDEQVIRAARGAAAALTGDSVVSAAAIARLPDLRIVATCTVGVDHIDLDAARSAGVWVCNVPDAATEEVAVHAMAMVLALIRHLPQFDRHVRAGGWDYLHTGTVHRPSTLTLGVVGMGRIGRRVATLGQPFFGRVIANDPYVDDDAWPSGVERAELDEVFASADLVSLHIGLTPETKGLVDQRRLGLMREHSYLVNVSRGGLVDHDALLAALDDGRLAGVGLDVLSAEPPRPDDPLLSHPRVLLSPHVAFLSVDAERGYYRSQAENVVSWLETGRPLTPVVEGT